MSRETATWLNTNVLIGFTEKRGHAWHYRASEQGDEPNHYPGPIPVEDVARRLFGWEELIGTVSVTALTDDGVLKIDSDKLLGVLRPPGTLGPEDKGDIIGIHSADWKAHSYRKWLLDNLSILLDDDDLHIGSAGLLQEAAQAWVQIELPETFRTPEDVEFRPFLLAATSMNASIATIYKRLIQKVVCDNTLAIGLGELGLEVRIKHTSNSLERLTTMRDTLKLDLRATADAFSDEVARLTAKRMTAPQWDKFKVRLTPIPDDAKPAVVTRATNKRAELQRLWDSDVRVAPWRETAYGALAAVNTYEHHIAPTRGKSRADRNMARALDGSTAAADAKVVAILDSVLA